MIGNVRNLEVASALAAALDGATLRLKGLVHRLRAGAQARLGRAGTPLHGTIAGTSVIPTVRYRDVPAAVTWLCRAFGMRVHRVVSDAGGAPRYAELTIGSGMLIVAPIEDTAFGRLMVQPDEIGGVETQVCYLRVGNARAHYARAKAAGAVIVIDPEDEANKGRGYSCRDPEGHVWNFGTYNPWGNAPPAPASLRWRLGRMWSLGRAWTLDGVWSLDRVCLDRICLGRVQQGLAALAVLALAAALALELLPQPSARAGTAVAGPPAATPLAAAERRPEPAQPTAQEAPARTDAKEVASAHDQANSGTPARHEAHLYRVALETAERSAADSRAQLAEARGALAKAMREAATARSELQDMQLAKLEAERAAEDARGRMATAQKAAARARAQAARERARRRAAARAAARARRGAGAARSGRTRSRSWCYSPYAPTSGRGRLIGFCRG